MNSVVSFTSSTCKNHSERFTQDMISKETIVCNALRMCHLDPKKQLKSPFFLNLAESYSENTYVSIQQICCKYFWLKLSQLHLLGMR